MIGAVLHRVDRGVDTRVSGQQNHQRVGIALLDPFEHAEPVTVRQSVIEQDQIDTLVVFGESAGRRLGFDYAVPFRSEPLGERPANQLLVVNDEDGGRLHDVLVYARASCTRVTRSWTSNGLLTTRYAPSASAPAVISGEP